MIPAISPPSIYSIVDAVNLADYPILPNTVPIPSLIFDITKIFCRIHCLYCWRLEYGDILTKAGYFRLYLMGNAFNIVAGSSGLVQQAAQVVLIVRRVLQATTQTLVVYTAWNDLLIVWVSHVEILPDPTKTQIALEGELFLRKICALYASFTPFASALWVLSCHYRLVIEAFSMTQAARSEAVNTLFVNTAGIFDKCATLSQLLPKLREQEPLVQKILLFFHESKPAKQWIDDLEKNFQTVDIMRQIGQGILNFTYEFGYDTPRRTWILVKSILNGED